MKLIRLSSHLSLPLEPFVTSTQLVVARKRSGKSHTAQVQAEDLLAAKQQIAVIDPTDAWWGLRSSADGGSAGYPITIFGGKHGDAPLDLHSGKKLAAAMVDGGFSAIFSLSKFPAHEWPTFCADFLGELYRLNSEAMHVFVDEADVCAPQNPGSKEQHRALQTMNDVVRRGGIKGIGCTMISQRSALVNKDLASQVDQIVVLRMSHHLDIDSVGSWVSKRTVPAAEREEMLNSLPSLPVGDAWVWRPSEVDPIFERIRVRAKRTFDSGRTPKAGERRVAPKVLAPVDVAKLGEEIAESVAKAKLNDPKALRAELVTLRSELERARTAKPAAPGKAPKVVKQKVEIIKPAEVRRMEALLKRTEKMIAAIHVIEERFGTALTGFRVEVKALGDQAALLAGRIQVYKSGGAAAVHVSLPSSSEPGDRPVRKISPRDLPSAPAPRDASEKKDRKPTELDANGKAKIVAGLRRIMIALAQRPQGLTYRQIGVRAGISTKGGTFSTYMSRARQEGWIVDEGETRKLTQQGLAALGHYDPLPQGSELAEYWIRELGGGAARMLRVLIDHYPNPMDGAKLGELAGVSHAGGTFSTYLSRMRGLELITGKNTALVAAEEICP